MQEYIALLSENLNYKKMEIIDDMITMHVESVAPTCGCPLCGEESDNRNSSYSKVINDLPMNNMAVKLKLKNRIFECENNECSKKYFSETFNFVKPRAHKTNRLIEYIEMNSLNVSSIHASKVMNQFGVKVGKSTICNLKKKKQLSIISQL